jgi:hypothetical protein
MATKTSFSSASENDTWAHFLAWAGNGIGAGLSTLGFVSVADAYSANGGSSSWANGTTNNALSNPNTIPAGTASITGLFGTAFPSTLAHARAGLPTTSFQGGWLVGTAYTVGQVVTFTPATGGQQTFMCWATGGVGIHPAGDATSKNFWTPYWFEIWKTNSGTLTNFYFKIEYSGSTGGNTWPEMSIQIGTASDGVGSILGGNFTQCEQVVQPTGAFTGPFTTFMSGDGANYLGILTWAGATGQNSVCVGFERSISGTVASAPVYNSAYVTYLVNSDSNNSSTFQNSLFLSGSGNIGTGFFGTAFRTQGWSCANVPNQSLVVNNTSPLLSVFPLVGYQGNPMTIFSSLSSIDAAEGSSVTANVYGATHTYLCSKITTFNTLATGSVGVTGSALAMRYE